MNAAFRPERAERLDYNRNRSAVTASGHLPERGER